MKIAPFHNNAYSFNTCPKSVLSKICVFLMSRLKPYENSLSPQFRVLNWTAVGAKLPQVLTCFLDRDPTYLPLYHHLGYVHLALGPLTISLTTGLYEIKEYPLTYTF